MTTELTEDEWREATTYDLLDWHCVFDTEDERDASWAAFLARVRRDAAREALDGIAGDFDLWGGVMDGDEVARRIRHHRDTHYPEGTP